jgi:hypothetical protein
VFGEKNHAGPSVYPQGTKNFMTGLIDLALYACIKFYKFVSMIEASPYLIS